jgi:hypothetical protein
MADWVSTKMLSGPGARDKRMEAEKKTASILRGISIGLCAEIFENSFTVS